MRYRKLDINGDMTFGNQQADFYRDSPDAVAQAVWTRLRLWVGEWFVDTTEGTPYQQAALGTGKSATISPAIRQRILETENVTSIESFGLAIDPDSRTASISTTINTAFGVVQLQGVI
jgi:hypothetical protein